MDTFCLCFSYPSTDPTATNSVQDSSNDVRNFASLAPQDTLADRALPLVQSIAQGAAQLHGCTISCSRNDNGTLNFYLTGLAQAVTNARGMLLRDVPVMTRFSLKVTRADLSSAPIRASNALTQEFHDRIQALAQHTLTQITISPVYATTGSPLLSNGNGVVNALGYFGLDTDRVCDIVITGPSDPVDVARIRCLVAIDEFSGLHADTCEIDHQLQPIVAGIKRSFIQSVQESTNTNIYMPFLLGGILGPKATSPDGAPPPQGRNNANLIWITGESFNVQRAKDMLLQATANVAKNVIRTEATLVPRKLDWMITEKLDELRNIMRDNATYIQFPAVGMMSPSITVLGASRVSVQRTIRFINQMACQYYTAMIWMLPQQYNMMMPNPSAIIPPNPQLELMLRAITRDTGAEIVFKNNAIWEVHGVDEQVVRTITQLLELDFVKCFRTEIHIRLELGVDQREFISGKKNGKLNKIHQTCGCKIKYETLSEANFLIDVSGSDISVLQGLALLQDELPAELSFHVPEGYHKRIIGVGGRSIQRIMKKYGVYVKFSNADEFATLGGYGDNMDNVIARTPRKNALNLEALKAAVLESIVPKDRDYIHEAFNVPRKYHRLLLGEKAPFIHDIEKQTNCVIRFPDKEAALDMIEIFGPEGPVNQASTMLNEHIPFEADYSVPPNPDLPALLATSDWTHFVERLKNEIEVSVSAFPAPPQSPHLSQHQQPPNHPQHPHSHQPPIREHFFRLRCQRNHNHVIGNAKELLEDFLLQHNMPVYMEFCGGAQIKKSDAGLMEPVRDVFAAFEAKVFGGGGAPDSPDFGRPEIHSPPDMSSRPMLRPAISHPNFRTATQHQHNNDIYHQSVYMYPSSLQLPDHDERPEDEAASGHGHMPGSTSSMAWRPAQLPPLMGGNVAFQRSSSRHQPDSKRGSDSLITSKSFSRNKNTNGWGSNTRAQSLDLTLSFSRIQEHHSPSSSSQHSHSNSQSHGQRPHSPTTESTIDFDTGASATPSPTAPAYSSLYPHSHSHSTTTLALAGHGHSGQGLGMMGMGGGGHGGHRQAQSIDAVASEHADIAQVISGLKGL